MTTFWNNREISVFTINTRSSDPDVYWNSFKSLVELTDGHDFDGMLCFSANETLIDPWLAAHFLVANSQRLIPIVAVNPVYMHPFSAAKMVSSFAYMHGRRTILNLITGASGRDREVLHDDIAHDARYDRLGEYAVIMKQLLEQDRMVDFSGAHYNLSQAVLSPAVQKDLHPGFLVAGHSEAAMRTAAKVDAVHLRMLDPKLEEGLPAARSGLGVHMGIIARDTEGAAWDAANARYPVDPDQDGILDFVMEGSDSVWKRKLYEQIKEKGNPKPGYWLEPFGQLKADCPYLVGSYDSVADSLAQHFERGVDWIILDLPPEEQEFEHSAKALRMAFERLGVSTAAE